MASATLSLTIHVRDLATVKLLYWQLEMLRNEMMLVGSPFAADLDRIINRKSVGEDDDGDETPVHES